jgi:hypothetical protein
MTYLMQLRTIKPKTGCHSLVFVGFAEIGTQFEAFLYLKGAQSLAQTKENGCLKKRSLTDGWQKEQGGQAWRRESSKAQSQHQSRMKINEEEGKKSSAATMRKRGSRTRGGGGEAGI